MQSYISKYLLGIKDTIPNKKRESDDFINLETELSYLLSTKEWNKTEEELSSQLARRVDITKKFQTKYTLNWKKLALFLSSLSYPFYYLDFETFQQPIPEFKGISPFQQIPFQYSVHVEQNNQTLEHKEFLGKEGSDPREQLVKQLIKDIPMNATILAFNASFEQMVLKGLAKQFAQYEDHLLSISENIIDIAIPFQKRYYYLPQMKGKHSIKIVLPLLVPEMAEARETAG
jgi:hypothetical protein